MAGKTYLAWKMLATAAHEDERVEQGLIKFKPRKALGDPLTNVSDKNFIKEYRLSKEAFEDLCALLKHHTDLKSTQRVSLKGKVLCALRFYAHGSYQRVTGKALHFSQEAMSVYIEEVTKALNNVNILKKFIKFPTTRLDRDTIKQSFSDKYGFPGVIGCIDCSHFKIIRPSREEEHLYYHRKNYYSINVQVICDDNCFIRSVNARFGGATHDAVVWENSDVNDYIQSLHRQNEFVWLLGDSAYPQQSWLMTPYVDAPQHSNQEAFNAVHTSARVVIKNTFTRLKNCWRCIQKDKTLRYHPEKCARIIIACCVLHNLARKYNLPDPEDSVEEPQESFEGYEEVRREQSDLLAREQSNPLTREQSDLLAREQSDLLAREQSDLLAREQSDQLAREQSDQLAREQSDLLAREQSDLLAREQSDLLAREQSDLLAREQSDLLARDQSDLLAGRVLRDQLARRFTRR